MATIKINNQAEWDALPSKFQEYTEIEIYGELDFIDRVIEKSYIWLFGKIKVMRGNSRVGVMWETSQVGVMRENSRVGALRGNSRVGEMWETSQVGVMRETSQVGVMWENSQVGVMRETSQVGVMRENSRVGVMRENSQVGVMWETSQVGVMWENSRVGVRSIGVSICLKHFSLVICMGIKWKDIKNKTKSKTTIVVEQPEFKRTRKSVLEMLPREDKSIILYKTTTDKFEPLSYNRNGILYKPNTSVVCPDFNPDETIGCGQGLHLSPTISEALRYNQSDTILKCLVSPKDIAVYTDNISKFRCRKVFVKCKVDRFGKELTNE